MRLSALTARRHPRYTGGGIVKGSKRAEARIARAMDVAYRYGGLDGAHHKEWVIDQMVRELMGDEYEAWVKNQKAGEDGPETYDWPEGIAPVDDEELRSVKNALMHIDHASDASAILRDAIRATPEPAEESKPFCHQCGEPAQLVPYCDECGHIPEDQ